MILTDTHSHLYAKELKEDLEQVIVRCKANGVERVFLPNIDIETIASMKDLVAKNKNMFYPMMGLHPCSVEENFREVLGTIKKELYQGDYIAVGETGIDLYWDKTTFPNQEEAFREQIEWSLDLDLPIVIHARESTQEILDILKDYTTKLRGVFHCFSGTEVQAKEVVERGMFIGVGGVLTFKNSNLKDIIKEVPLDKVVLETDSPYLAPVPYRGKRNESSYILNIAEFMADTLGYSLEEIGDITTRNSKKLFGC